jgi:hypothetical protein
LQSFATSKKHWCLASLLLVLAYPPQGFYFQFCDVAKLTIITTRFSPIWLYTRCESRNFLRIVLYFGYYLLEPVVEIWQIKNISSQNLEN